MEQQTVDHLFRHQYGKMIAVLTGFFGLAHLETIEDAVQDTFIKATLSWREQRPDNPEAWLMQAAKNRMIDLLRQIKAEKGRFEKLASGAASIQLNELFLDHEVEDSQLRMIFVACSPSLAREEQIAFSLKTISGFSMKEIAAALLTKEETIKKRLVRARKTIVEKKIEFAYPQPHEVDARLAGVMQVVYLIFNEGFHSTRSEELVRTDLCGEAIRLSQLLLKKDRFRSGSLYALFALMCFHAARIESKVGADGEIVDLEHQDRSKWYGPLIQLGKDALNQAMEYPDWSSYHYEAAIAGEHIRARRFEETNWTRILDLYNQLYELQPTDTGLLNIASVLLQLDRSDEAKKKLDAVVEAGLQQRAYLLHGCYAEYYHNVGDQARALTAVDRAIALASNEMEKRFLTRKRSKYLLSGA